MSQKDVFCIGIDLGTTNSVMAYVDKNGFPQVILNSESENVTPSVVYWEQDDAGLIKTTVGDDAVPYSITDPEHTVKSIKRKMGTNETVMVFGHQMTPEEISSLILMKLKDDAELHFQREVTHAVITHPPYLNVNEKAAIRNAAVFAGWDEDNVWLIDEYNAAGYAYIFDRQCSNQEIKKGEKFFILDIGGETFNCTIGDYYQYLRRYGPVFQSLGEMLGNELGGDDFDDKIFQWVADQYQKEVGVDVNEDLDAKAQVMDAVRKAKESLSKQNESKIIVNLEPPLELVLTLEKFNELCEELYHKVENVIDETLERKYFRKYNPNIKSITPSEIDNVVILGGSSKIKAIRQLIDRKFPDSEIFQHNENRIIAQGAAIYGLLHFHQPNAKMNQVATRAKKEMWHHGQYLSHTISFQVIDELGESPMVNIFHKDTYLPIHTEKIFKNRVDNQKSFKINLYEGEYELAQDNDYIGQILVLDLLPKPAWSLKLKLLFRIDDSKFEVEAVLEDEKNNLGDSIIFKLWEKD